jgi:hypothetical protein
MRSKADSSIPCVVPSPERLAAYLAMGVGSSMLATAEVEAAVVAIDLTNVGGVNITGANAGLTYNGRGISISNWLGAGTGTLNIGWEGLYIGITGNSTSSGLFFAATGVGYASPQNFAANAPISASASFMSPLDSLFFYDGFMMTYSSPNFGANSFMGFKFGSGSTWNYGYIEVLWTWGGTKSTSAFQLLSAAYESTANTAILAGALPTPVPAPSALALLALGGGAFRRARQRAA